MENHKNCNDQKGGNILSFIKNISGIWGGNATENNNPETVVIDREELQDLIDNQKIKELVTKFETLHWPEYQNELRDFCDLLLTFREEKLFEPMIGKIGNPDDYCEATLEYFYELCEYLQHPLRGDLARKLELEKSTPEVYFSYDYSGSFISRFIQLFKGREGVHAEQFKGDDRCGYRPVHQALNPVLLQKHLNGERSLGTYIMQKNNCVSFMAIDVDIQKRVLEFGAEDIKEILRELRDEIIENIPVLTELGFDPLIEFSGYKGFHIWCFFDEPIPAPLVRAFFRIHIEKKFRFSARFQMELNPKQEAVRGEGLGNLIKLPMGKHLKNNRFSRLLNEKGEFIKNQAERILSLKLMPKRQFLEMCGEVDYADTETDKKYVLCRNTIADTGTENEALPVEFPKEIIFRQENHSDLLLRLYTCCDTLRTLRNNIENNQHVTAKERHVLVYTLTHLKEEGILEIHRLLSKTQEYDPDEVNRMIQAVSPNPIGCQKIRNHIADVAGCSNCNCQFNLQSGQYDSPLNHLDGLLGPLPLAVSAARLNSRKKWVEGAQFALTQGRRELDRFAEEYCFLKRKIAESRDKLNDLLTLIQQEFAKQEKEEIETVFGLYRLIRQENGEVDIEFVKKPQLEENKNGLS